MDLPFGQKHVSGEENVPEIIVTVVDCVHERLGKKTESLDSLIQWQLGRFDVYQRQVVVLAFTNLFDANLSPLVDFSKERIGLTVMWFEAIFVVGEEALYFDVNVVDDVLEYVVHFNSRFAYDAIDIHF
jgi:hypothetical protein